MKKWLIPLLAIVAIAVLALPAAIGSANHDELIKTGHLPVPCNNDIGIEIRKEAEGPDSRTFPSGSQVTFEIEVSNPCDLDLDNIEITDPQVPECDLSLPLLRGNINSPPVGESFTYTCTTTQGVTAGFTNEIFVSAFLAGSTAADDEVKDSDESTVVITPADQTFCDDGLKPSVLSMRLDGGGAADSNHSQDAGKVSVTGADVTTGPVFIIVSDKEDPFHSKAKTFFSGSVALGGNFDISAVGVDKGDKLPGDTRVFIYSSDPGTGGTLIQTIKFHTSCSQPLNFDDQYGAIVLVGFAGV